jgi:tetratricopeptide (TPR) repeat protein
MNKYIPLSLFILISLCSFSQSKTASYYIEIAIEYSENKNYDKAFKTLDKAIVKMPDSTALYDLRGALSENIRQYEEAIKYFTIGIEKAKNHSIKSHLLANRGGTKYRIRDFKGSFSDLTLAFKLDSTNIDALNNLAAVCGDINKPEEALNYYLKSISIDSNYYPAYINLGFEYQAKEDHKKAIEYFDKAIKLEPEDALGYSNRSFSKLKTDDLKNAMNDILHSIKLMPSNSYAFKIKGLIEIEMGELSKACDDFTKSLELGYTNQYGEEVNDMKKKYCK